LTAASYAALVEEADHTIGSTLEAASPILRVEVKNKNILVTVKGTEPPWFEPVISKVQQLLKLAPNWDSYDALPVKLHSAAAAIRFLGWAMQENTVRPSLIPTVEGNITLEWHTHGLDLEITVSPDGPSYLSFENQRTGEVIEKPVSSESNVLGDVVRKIPVRR